MAEMGDISPEKKSGCGLLGAVFGRGSFWLRRSTSTGSLPGINHHNNIARQPSTPNTKRRRGGSDEAAFLEISSAPSSAEHAIPPHRSADRIVARPPPNYSKTPLPVYHQQHQHHQQQNHQGRKMNETSSAAAQNQNRKVPKESMGISGELDIMINDYQQSKGSSGLVRASSSNVMLFGNLGNLGGGGGGGGGGGVGVGVGGGNSNPYRNATDYPPSPQKTNGRYGGGGGRGGGGLGNVGKKQNEENSSYQQQQPQPTSLCRALSTRMDPETLKIMGNEDYKNGRFAEALALYDAAISIDPNKASYRSNKSAALTALGKILEAVFECREAIRIDPQYHRAHHRLANLYLRLGEAEKAIYHYKHAGPDADREDIAKAQTLQAQLNKCTEAKKQRDWNSLIKETGRAISSGADSAPQIYALQAETFLKLHRHHDADTALTNGPNFEVDDCTKFFGPIGNANLLMVRAQVDMAAGRFDDALAAAQRAARLDSNSKEVNMVARRARAVAQARFHGNELFKASRFSEACVAYGEGLDHDPFNSVLLCNRAACRSKLRQFEKAVEDCNAALNVRPYYSKARLRRADCNAKLGKWEASIQDYETLITETPDDEEVERALTEARVQLRKQRGEDVKDVKEVKSDNSCVVVVSSNDRFRDLLSPGISVVFFCNKPGNKQTLQLMEQLCKKYPTVTFLKVEVEDHPHIAKSEGVNSLPVFKIYKNESRVKEISGDNHELLESSIKFYTT